MTRRPTNTLSKRVYTHVKSFDQIAKALSGMTVNPEFRRAVYKFLDNLSVIEEKRLPKGRLSYLLEENDVFFSDDLFGVSDLAYGDDWRWKQCHGKTKLDFGDILSLSVQKFLTQRTSSPPSSEWSSRISGKVWIIEADCKVFGRFTSKMCFIWCEKAQFFDKSTLRKSRRSKCEVAQTLLPSILISQLAPEPQPQEYHNHYHCATLFPVEPEKDADSQLAEALETLNPFELEYMDYFLGIHQGDELRESPREKLRIRLLSQPQPRTGYSSGIDPQHYRQLMSDAFEKTDALETHAGSLAYLQSNFTLNFQHCLFLNVIEYIRKAKAVTLAESKYPDHEFIDRCLDQIQMFA